MENNNQKELIDENKFSFQKINECLIGKLPPKLKNVANGLSVPKNSANVALGSP